MADIREIKTFIGYKKQTGLQTALVAADGWSLRQTNRTPGQPEFQTEDDKDDLGKGTPFATQVFKTSAGAGFPWEARLTSENAAMLAVFGIGSTACGSTTSGATSTFGGMAPPLSARNDRRPTLCSLGRRPDE